MGPTPRTRKQKERGQECPSGVVPPYGNRSRRVSAPAPNPVDVVGECPGRFPDRLPEFPSLSFSRGIGVTKCAQVLLVSPGALRSGALPAVRRVMCLSPAFSLGNSLKEAFNNFVGVRSVSKAIQVSRVQFYNTAPMCCTVCSAPSQLSSHLRVRDPPLPNKLSRPLSIFAEASHKRP